MVNVKKKIVFFFAGRVLWGMARTRVALQTDGHTRREKQYLSPAGGET